MDGTWKDSSGHGYDASPSDNMAWTDDEDRGTVGVFDGASYLKAEDLQRETNFTVVAFVKTTKTYTDNNRILETSYSQDFYLGTNASNNYWLIVNYGQTTSLGNAQGGPIANDEWQMVAGTFVANSSTSGLATLYVGDSTGTTAVATETFHPHANQTIDLFIGRFFLEDNVDGFYWTGYMDDVAIWNRTLSSAEISQVNTLGVAGYEATLNFVTNGDQSPEPGTIVSMLTGLLLLSYRRIFRMGEGRASGKVRKGKKQK